MLQIVEGWNVCERSVYCDIVNMVQVLGIDIMIV